MSLLRCGQGTKLWKPSLPAKYLNTYGDGPRSTPTIEGKFVYTQFGTGTVDVPRGGKRSDCLVGQPLQEIRRKNLFVGDRGVAAR